MSARTAAAVVVGGGVAGASAFFHLAALGVGRVILCERRTPAGEATGTGSTGGFIQYHFCRTPEETRLTQASLPYFERWDELVGAGDCGFVRAGYIRLEPPAREGFLRERVAMLQSLGVNTRVATADDVAALAPALRTDGVAAAAVEPDSGYADPEGTVAGFIEAGVRLGGELLADTTVTRVRHASGRVSGIDTTAGPIDAPLVVLAAGAWSDALLSPLGIALPIVVWRTQWLGITAAPALPLDLPTVGDGVNGCYYRALRPGSEQVVLGLGGVGRRDLDDLEAGEGTIPAELAASGVERLAASLRAPHALRAAGGRSGPVAQTPDALPVIDRHPGLEGLVYTAGDCGTSFKTGPAIGRALAEWALHGQPSSDDIAAFAAARFAAAAAVAGG